jgi:hypothetical protein
VKTAQNVEMALPSVGDFSLIFSMPLRRLGGYQTFVCGLAGGEGKGRGSEMELKEVRTIT